MTWAVQLDGVCVSLGERRVLDRVTLHVDEHEAVALLGANGVGKSTLLDLVLGLRTPDAGTALVLGAPPPATGVGFVPQDPGASLFPWLTVQANILLPLRVQGASPSACAAALEALLARLDPGQRLDVRARPQQLSGGERQLVALMRGLITHPRLLVCDEPFASVDGPARARLQDALAGLRRQPDGPAILMVTHDVEEAVTVADRAVILVGRPARVHTAVNMAEGSGASAAIHQALLSA